MSRRREAQETETRPASLYETTIILRGLLVAKVSADHVEEDQVISTTTVSDFPGKATFIDFLRVFRPWLRVVSLLECGTCADVLVSSLGDVLSKRKERGPCGIGFVGVYLVLCGSCGLRHQLFPCE